MLFIYFALILNTYLIAFLVALFFEYPFRTLGKVVFSPPKRVIRLKNELAKELNANFDSVFDDKTEDDNEEVENQDYIEEMMSNYNTENLMMK